MRIFKDKGFSLLEVLVALAVLGVLLAGLSTMMKQESLVMRNSAEALQARLIANETMETLRAAPFEELQSHSFTSDSELKNMTVDVLVSDFVSETLKEIVVTVVWIDVQGREKNVVLSTLRSKYPLSEAEAAVSNEVEGMVLSSIEGGGSQ
jgi:prepilin-type N-terminal cleavage/methylation domain-containing protein